MELRWTRINQIDMNSDFSNLHINRFKRYYHRDSCNLARHRNFGESSAADGIREEYRQNKWCHDTPGTICDDQIINVLTQDEILKVLPALPMIPRSLNLKRGSSLLIGMYTVCQ